LTIIWLDSVTVCECPSCLVSCVCVCVVTDQWCLYIFNVCVLSLSDRCDMFQCCSCSSGLRSCLGLFVVSSHVSSSAFSGSAFFSLSLFTFSPVPSKSLRHLPIHVFVILGVDLTWVVYYLINVIIINCLTVFILSRL